MLEIALLVGSLVVKLNDWRNGEVSWKLNRKELVK
jgi:hypothetical protein